MQKTKKRLRNALFVSATLLLVILFILQLRAAVAVENYLDRKLPSHIALKYDDIDVNVLRGKVELNDIDLNISNRDTAIAHTTAHIEKLSLDGFGYWNFWALNTISAKKLRLVGPQVKYFLQNRTKPKDTVHNGIVNLLKQIKLNKLVVENGYLIMYQEKPDSILVKAPKINFSVSDLETGPEIIREMMPLTYGDYDFDSRKIMVDLGSFEKLNISRINIKDDNLVVDSLVVLSKYNKKELSRKVVVERDHINLNIPQINFDSIGFGFDKRTFYLSSSLGTFKSPELALYRDKLVADDLSEKRLYAEILRKLPLKLNLRTLSFDNGKVIYEERVDPDGRPGKIVFQNFDATIDNISNTYAKGNYTKVHATAKLMGDSKMNLNVKFDFNDLNDRMYASGSVENFDSKNLNQFLSNNLGARANGKIDRLFFTIDGNKNKSRGNMKMQYRNFKFSVLREDGLGVNKVLTAIGNLFVNDGSKTDTDGFRHGKIEVERDLTKSYFNYLWLNVRDGIVHTLIGDGEKKD